MRHSDKVLRVKWMLVNLTYRLTGRKRGTVLERLVNYKVRPADWQEALDDAVEEWHVSDTKMQLHEFMGMTWEEYGRWAERPSEIYAIVNEHRHKEFRNG